jgi:hypothetical protein
VAKAGRPSPIIIYYRLPRKSDRPVAFVESHLYQIRVGKFFRIGNRKNRRRDRQLGIPFQYSDRAVDDGASHEYFVSLDIDATIAIDIGNRCGAALRAVAIRRFGIENFTAVAQNQLFNLSVIGSDDQLVKMGILPRSVKGMQDKLFAGKFGQSFTGKATRTKPYGYNAANLQPGCPLASVIIAGVAPRGLHLQNYYSLSGDPVFRIKSTGLILLVLCDKVKD